MTTKSAGSSTRGTSAAKERSASKRRVAPARDADTLSAIDAWVAKIEQLFATLQARALLVVLVLASVLVIGIFFGLEVAVLMLAGVALLLVIWLMWLSLQSLTGETPLGLEEAMSFAAPSAEEERKRSVLRALKDLEYERSVGKISEQDYVELSTRYRDEAKALIRALAEGNSEERARVERAIAERMAELGPAAPAPEPVDDADTDEPSDDADQPVDDEPDSDSAPSSPGESAAPEPEPKAKPAATAATAAPAARATPMPTRRCAKCSTRNELDAGFCKHCGEKMARSDEVLCRACPRVYDRSEPVCPDCGVRQEAE